MCVCVSCVCSFIQDPKQIVSCIDFRYITDVLTEEEALGETRFIMYRKTDLMSPECSF